MIIGLGYRARSGKDTIAELLKSNYDFEVVAFADALKSAAREIFGFDTEQLYGKYKETIDPFWNLTPRRALQILGTESVRNIFGEDTWVKALRRRIRPGEANYVITDMRFPNEVAAVQHWGGIAVRVDRDVAGAKGGVEGHASETALDSFIGWDYVIDNNGTLADLDREVDALVRFAYEP